MRSSTEYNWDDNQPQQNPWDDVVILIHNDRALCEEINKKAKEMEVMITPTNYGFDVIGKTRTAEELFRQYLDRVIMGRILMGK